MVTILFLLLLEQRQSPRAADLATSKSLCSPVMGLPGRPGFSSKLTCTGSGWGGGGGGGGGEGENIEREKYLQGEEYHL